MADIVVWNRQANSAELRRRRLSAHDNVQRNQRPPAHVLEKRSVAEFEFEPFVHVAMGRPNPVADVTLFTQCSEDRLNQHQQLTTLVATYNGPVSLAVYVEGGRAARAHVLSLVQTLSQQSDSVRQFLDVHLLYANGTRYPVNSLRNLAMLNSRTQLVLTADIDLVPAPNLHQILSQSYHNIGDQTLSQSYHNIGDETLSQSYPNIGDETSSQSYHNIGEGEGGGEGVDKDKLVFVVPNFESVLHSASAAPRDKQELRDQVRRGLLTVPQLRSCPLCHRPTSHHKWLHSTVPFLVDYRWIYEPFLMFRLNLSSGTSSGTSGTGINANGRRPPSELMLFDDRFKGYGFDKNTFTFQLAALGYRFLVLPAPFLIHQDPERRDQPQGMWDGGLATQRRREQQTDLLPFVCLLLNETRLQLGLAPDHQLFDEPVPSNCMTSSHW